MANQPPETQVRRSERIVGPDTLPSEQLRRFEPSATLGPDARQQRRGPDRSGPLRACC